MMVASKMAATRKSKRKNNENFAQEVTLVLVFIVFALTFISLFLNLSILDSVREPLVSPTPSPVNLDKNILSEIRQLNFFSQCVVDSNSIRNIDLPIDDDSSRRVLILTLICPELQGVN